MFYLMNSERTANPFLPNMDTNTTPMPTTTAKKIRVSVVDVLSAATKNERPAVEETRKFHLGDILAVMMNCAILSPRGNDGMQTIITFLCQRRCPDPRLGDLGEVNRLWFYAKTRLEIQFPELMKQKEEFEKAKEDSRKMRNADLYLKSWAVKQTKIYGTMHFVRTVIEYQNDH